MVRRGTKTCASVSCLVLASQGFLRVSMIKEFVVCADE